MRRHRNLLSLLCSLPLLIASTNSGGAERTTSVPEPFLNVTEKGLTLKADGVPLNHILTRIAELYGTPIALEGKLATPVTIAFRDLSLQDAIRRLVADAPFMILHEPPSSDGVPARPSKIWVYAAASGTRTGRALREPDKDQAQQMSVKPTTESA